MAVTIPILLPVSSRTRPCSMCSSRKAFSSSGRRAADFNSASWAPLLAAASLRVTPVASLRSRYCSASTKPVMTLLPRVATPKRLDSSPTNKITSKGCLVTMPFSLIVLMAAIAAITPATPSKSPPWGTESKWDPQATAGRESSSPGQRAMRLPMASLRILPPVLLTWSLQFGAVQLPGG